MLSLFYISKVTFFFFLENIDLDEEQCTIMLNYITSPHKENEESHKCEPLPGWQPTLTLEKVIRLTTMHCGTRYTLSCLRERTSFAWSDELRNIYTSLLRALELENKQK